MRQVSSLKVMYLFYIFLYPYVVARKLVGMCEARVSCLRVTYLCFVFCFCPCVVTRMLVGDV